MLVTSMVLLPYPFTVMQATVTLVQDASNLSHFYYKVQLCLIDVSTATCIYTYNVSVPVKIHHIVGETLALIK